MRSRGVGAGLVALVLVAGAAAAWLASADGGRGHAPERTTARPGVARRAVTDGRRVFFHAAALAPVARLPVLARTIEWAS